MGREMVVVIGWSSYTRGAIRCSSKVWEHANCQELWPAQLNLARLSRAGHERFFSFTPHLGIAGAGWIAAAIPLSARFRSVISCAIPRTTGTLLPAVRRVLLYSQILLSPDFVRTTI